MKSNKKSIIVKTKAEIQSGSDRQRWAEGLITQLPQDHEGRNSWLLNYGISIEAQRLREHHPSKPKWDVETHSAENHK